jgi:integral membrane sensor domain MASE1
MSRKPAAGRRHRSQGSCRTGLGLMKNFVLVGILLLVWIASMLFYLPLPVVVILFAAVVASASVVIWLSLMKRRTHRSYRHHGVIKTDAKA